MFSMTDAKGFKMQFANGYVVSVQWGPLNLCERQDEAIGTQYTDKFWTSQTAEVAVYEPNGDMLQLFDDQPTHGYVKADDVLEIMKRVASL